jgi:hypothetical protein
LAIGRTPEEFKMCACVKGWVVVNLGDVPTAWPTRCFSISMAAMWLSVEGTHMGGLLAPATGRKVVFAGIVMARIVDGRIAEAWNNIDQLGLLKQIGALPDSGPDRFLTKRR